MACVAVFAGHVGKDVGAIDGVDPASGDNIHTVEAVLTNSIAERVCDILDSVGVETVLSFGSLEKRIEETVGCAAGVSIHVDVSTSSEVKGHHTLYYPGSVKGKQLAFCLDRRLSLTYDRTRQPHPENMYILRKTAFPCVLTEVGFMSNPLEERWLWDRQHRRVVAMDIATGIRDYLYFCSK
jgi:N-acetylmuramoyl-L-alanine amidase